MTEGTEKKIKAFLHKLGEILYKLDEIGIKEFSKRIAGLENNMDSFGRRTIRSGLVGITSSGKSSVLNVLLGRGEKILKEQSKATTNMIVFCSKADKPILELHFDNGETIVKSGEEVLSQSIWKYTSEDENPNNQFSVKFIKLALPTFLFDKDIELADTPGLDAFGHKEHEDLTLREFLPQADLIFYLSSIRSPMKEADRKILNKIMDADQRIIFVQTCKGAVVEQNYGEDSTDSTIKLLEKHKKDFEEAISHYDKLKDAPIVQVETTHAIKFFKNNDIDAWKESGLDDFLQISNNVKDQLQEEYLFRSLKKIVDESNALKKLILNSVKEEGEKEGSLDDQSKYLQKLKDYFEKIVQDKDYIVKQWSDGLNHNAMFARYKHELSRIFGYVYDYNPAHDKEFMRKVHEISEHTRELKDDFLNTIDSAKERFRTYFNELGMDVRRTDLQSVSQSSFFLPNVETKQVSDKVDTSRASLFGSKDISKEYIDKSKYLEDLRVSLKVFFEPLTNHFEFWQNTVSFSFMEPLQHKIAAIEDDMKNIKKGVTYNESQYKKMTHLSREIEASLTDIAPLCNIDVEQLRTYKKFTSTTIAIKRKSEDRNLFLQLSHRLFESMFHSYYLNTLSQISDKPKKSVVLIGHDFEGVVNFLRRFLRAPDESIKAVLEVSPPFSVNSDSKDIKMSNIEIKGEFHDTITFYVLSNDGNSLNAEQTNGLCEKADIVQIMVEDLHRVASAVTDLKERNLFYDTIYKHKNKLLLTYPRAAYFQKERLHILVDEAVTEIEKIFEPERPHWFIYENFEVRYNYFYKYSEEIISRKLKAAECLKEWKSQGIPLDDPFNEKVLIDQFEEIANLN